METLDNKAAERGEKPEEYAFEDVAVKFPRVIKGFVPYRPTNCALYHILWATTHTTDGAEKDNEIGKMADTAIDRSKETSISNTQ